MGTALNNPDTYRKKVAMPQSLLLLAVVCLLGMQSIEAGHEHDHDHSDSPSPCLFCDKPGDVPAALGLETGSLLWSEDRPCFDHWQLLPAAVNSMWARAPPSIS
ncbi:MAG: hypothetical protein AAGA91_01050 [Pseudomonadota bacterium]